MRIQLNFIRGRVATYRLKSLRQMIFGTFLLVFLLCFMFMGYVYIDNYYEIKSYQNRLALVSERFAKLNEEVFRIVEYKKEWDSLREKISLVSELKGKQMWWTPKLEALSKLMPDNIWLSSISASSTNITLKGFALPGDNWGFRSVENFVQELKEDPTFGKILGEIDLSTVARTGAENLPVMSFQLSCAVVSQEGQ
ncbi:hypothetical protein CEE34_04795 [Candidatus Aerophobetes bacterium Ae_b3a]|nr:MAG: hypothetical protein CEE34_04795 [Candidatus Aerophobetes bacterium Ae_b3a]